MTANTDQGGLQQNGCTVAATEASAGPTTEVAEGLWALSYDVYVGFLLRSDLAPSTRATYRGDLREVFAWAAANGTVPIAMSRRSVDVYVHHLRGERGLAPTTVARKLSALRAWYRYGLQEGVLPRDPTAHIRRPRVVPTPPRVVLDAEHARALLAAADIHSNRASALIRCLILSGVRVGDLLSATADGFVDDPTQRTLLLPRCKGGGARRIALAPSSARALRRYLAGRSDGAIFTTRTGRPLDRTGAWRLVRAIGHRALPDALAARFHPHALRGLHIHLCLCLGVPIHVVADGVGHAGGGRTTLSYVRGMPSKAPPTARLLEELLEAPRKGAPPSISPGCAGGFPTGPRRTRRAHPPR